MVSSTFILPSTSEHKRLACFRGASILLKKKKSSTEDKEMSLRDFLDGLVVTIPHFIKGGTGSPIRGQGTKIPHVAKK